MTTETAVILSPVGRLMLRAVDGALAHVSLTDAPEALPRPGVLQRCAVQLQEYFAGERRVFDVPLAPQGTDFQRAVWQALQRIPYGETRSYGQIAAEIGRKGGMRAVGQANRANPVLIVIPCHRVVRSDGKTGGYSGGENMKAALIALEERSAAGEIIYDSANDSFSG